MLRKQLPRVRFVCPMLPSERIFRYPEMRAASHLLGGCCCEWRIKLTSWRRSQRENDLCRLYRSNVQHRRCFGNVNPCGLRGPLTFEWVLVDVKWIEFVRAKFNILSFQRSISLLFVLNNTWHLWKNIKSESTFWSVL